MLAFAPHIALFHSTLGLSWPALPSSLITIVSVVTLTLFVAVLFRRVTSPVMRLISNFDDYFTWVVTATVLVTGLAATAHLGGRYATLLGLHILSFDLLLVWFPCGKLMHAFYIMPSRALNGFLLSRKGAPS
jgi:nitrate reductase gamma subunit